MDILIRIFCTVGVILVLASCTVSNSLVLRTDGGTGPPETIVGIMEQLNESDSADVIILHGMCFHDLDWAKEVNTTLAKAAGMSPDDSPSNPVVGTGTTKYDAALYSFKNTLGKKVLNVHAIVWAPLTRRAKESLCYDERSKSKICQGTSENKIPRVLINTIAKDVLVNDCLSDVTAYIGSEKHIKNEVSRLVLLALAGESGKESSNKSMLMQIASERTTPLFFVSESLGSRILFDVLKELTTEADGFRSVQSFLNRSHGQVFMGANQLPLLALANLTENEEEKKTYLVGKSDQTSDIDESNMSNFGTDPFENLIRTLKQNNHDAISLNDFHLVAFSDPNDILSYMLLNSNESKGKSYKSTDVVVHNAHRYFWLWENPYKAHVSYLTNSAVARIIVCGYPEIDHCKAN